MKTIAYIVSVFPSTSATFVLNELLMLKRQGFNIKVLSLRQPIGEIKQEGIQEFDEIIYIPHLREGVSATITLVIGSLKYMFKYPRKYFKVLKRVLNKKSRRVLYDFIRATYVSLYLEDNKIDHIHSQFAHSPTNIAYFVNLLIDKNYSFTCHAVDIFLDKNRVLLEEQLKNALFAVTISHFNINYIKKLISEEKSVDKFRVVRCGIDYNKFKKNETKKYNNKVQIFSVGRFVDKKGFIYLIEALKEVRDKRIEFDCRIVGDGPLHEEIEQKVTEYKLNDCVSLVGAVGTIQIRKYLENADVFILPCIQADNGDMDGIPVSLMEAMAFEIPVISTTISGIPELIEDKVSGILVEPKNVDQLQSAIELIINNPKLRKKYGEEGRKKVIQEFGLKENTQILIDEFMKNI